MAPPRKRITLSTEGVEGTNSRRISSWNNISSDEDEISVVEVVPVPQRSRRALSPWGKDKKLEWEVVIPWKIDLDRSIFREIPGENHVRKVIEEMEEPITHELRYKTRFADGHIETLGFDQLISLNNGEKALQVLTEGLNTSESSDSDVVMVETRKTRTRAVQTGYTSWNAINLSGDEDELNSKPRRGRPRKVQNYEESSSTVNESEPEDIEEKEDEDSEGPRPRRSTRQVNQARTQTRLRLTHRADNNKTHSRDLRNSRRSRHNHSDDESDESNESSSDEGDDGEFHILRSNVPRKGRKRKRHSYDWHAPLEGTRRSERSRRDVDMREVDVDDIYRQSSPPTPAGPKILNIREVFKQYPEGMSFESATLSGREHLVTKIAEDEFVLQCRRCVNIPQRKDSIAPDHARCQDCKESGASCAPFRERKTAAQEQKERDENDGIDPVVHINPCLINNAENVLFRCMRCWRAFHYHHLPSRKQYAMDMDYADQERADARFAEVSHDWKCKDCFEMGDKKVSTVVAWRPIDIEAYNPGVQVEYVDEDEKEYLVKWENHSYFQVNWMPGAWVWGTVAHGTRKAFFKQDPAVKMSTEDAIPEEYLRIDIVLDVKYSNIIDIHTDEIDRARIKEVDTALIKYKGLGYEDAVWEGVPDVEDEDRWSDFVTAYNDWVLGRYTHLPKPATLKVRVDKVRAQKFMDLEKSKQPENLIGGELMKYQLDGLNWIYHQWHNKKNCILADEMGLGKTIQIIAFLAMMVNDHNCFPFLIVVPNSTCPNWRREIKQWAPSLRVVTYFGSAAARKLAHDYELFPDGTKDLRCHVVVTSYDAVQDDSNRRVFRSVQWQGLIVDEGQRLKNDKSILHNVLKQMRVPFRMLLTGTPLQNNIRELFNLLQFLDDTIDAEAMQNEYTVMTKENITTLHDLIRPFILRRTKAQVLTFLPAMAQVILPVSMTVLQKRVYKSILTKKPELLRVLFSADKLKPTERASFNNVLMQLRKCLCHPFVFSGDIEERNLHHSALHRNLVEASSKLKLLELLLPKLKERGHRVLIFSQFLDMLSVVEDFLDGLKMKYQRLDGTINSLEKQKRIDEFNAEDSPLFAFLLSTRAGGVGINLATADTVIIMDPDFNPHQDIQALSRAHRIGQTKKVLCFQMMTRASAEEKIMQFGRKKMALDHVVVEALDAEDMEDKDVESILRYGAAELFNDDGKDKEIRYDDASIEKLLDRTQIEKTVSGVDDSAETQFSLARVWANDQSTLEDAPDINAEEAPPDPGVWQKILDARARAAAIEAAAKADDFGRGKRSRIAVDYGTNEGITNEGVLNTDEVEPLSQEQSSAKFPRNSNKRSEDSDTDFRADFTDGERESESDSGAERKDPSTLGVVPQYDGGISGEEQPRPARRSNKKQEAKLWSRASVARALASPHKDDNVIVEDEKVSANQDASPKKKLPQWRHCPVCGETHPIGSCPLKLAGVEKCPLCGLAHYGHARSCPHLKSETMVILMLETLKQSSEPRYLVEAATKYLRGVKGSLAQAKKRAAEAAEAAEAKVRDGNGNGNVNGGVQGKG